MQDRFKFRGLSKGKWYYGAYFKHLPYTPHCCGKKPPEKDYKHLIIQEGFSDWGLPRSMTCIEVEKDTVGQCTGLKDKNKKLIYENDIVKRNGELLIVRYQAEMSCLAPQHFYLENDEIVYCSREWFEEYNSENCKLYTSNSYEIIGNIYQNKELLKSEKE